jgi:hypothetical protein
MPEFCTPNPHKSRVIASKIEQEPRRKSEYFSDGNKPLECGGLPPFRGFAALRAHL